MGNTTSSHKISAQDRAILEMKIQRDKLHQYQKKVTALTTRETAIAKECLARGDKSRALLALRRKKYQESLLAKTDAQLEQLQSLTSDVEFSLVQKDVLYGLQQGTSVLKMIQKEIGGIDQVEKLLGENDEARAYQREVSEMLAGGGMSNGDEDEVEDELEALQREVEGVKVEPTPKLPEVPNGDLEVGNRDEEKEREEKRKARARERAKEQQRAGPMLA
ncbi:MAG: Vacuolar protein sorting-associated protein 20 [Icmadophila ericetorum]|nr:Vacuolar protein sorting-associated protein 20 [Icmadophila ericetorum]